MAVSSADKKKLGKWIKQAREKKQPHLSQRQLALAVDITNASLSSIESGMIFPSEELLIHLKIRSRSTLQLWKSSTIKLKSCILRQNRS